MRLQPSLLYLCCGTLLLMASTAGAQCGPDQVPLLADRDNTLYEDTLGELSNGAGQYIFTGATLVMGVRRALLRFDVAGALPAGATVESAALWLQMTMTRAGPEDVSLHPVLSDWGEGTSMGFGEEGGGAPATPGDATWLHTFYDTDFWTNPGGDFEAAASATTTVDDFGPYSWGSTPDMVADVQSWLDDPAANHGWIVVGNEAVTLTAKRFGSRENLDPASVPVLCVGFSEPPVVEIPTVGEFGLILLALGLAALALRRLR